MHSRTQKTVHVYLTRLQPALYHKHFEQQLFLVSTDSMMRCTFHIPHHTLDLGKRKKKTKQDQTKNVTRYLLFFFTPSFRHMDIDFEKSTQTLKKSVSREKPDGCLKVLPCSLNCVNYYKHVRRRMTRHVMEASNSGKKYVVAGICFFMDS